MPGPEHRRVTRFFGEGRQPPRQPPRQRVKPEDGAVEECQPLDQRVAPADVLLLVNQDSVEVSG
jgi:hypothetical protein